MEWTDPVTIVGITVAAVFGVILLLLLAIAYWKLGIWRLLVTPWIVGPEEMAIKVIIGKPKEFLDSGLHWVPLFFRCYLQKFPKKMYNLDYPAREAVTRRGTINEVEYGAQVLKVDSVAYVSFPQCYAWLQYKDQQGDLQAVKVKSEKALAKKEDELRQAGMTDIEVKGGLVEIYRRQIPTEEKELTSFTEEAIVGALRIAMGKVTWREATEDIEIVRQEAERVFKSSDGALLTAGFHPDDLRLAIEEIKLPPELERALPEPDAARLRADAAPFVAEERAMETAGTLIRMLAQATGRPPEKVQELIRTADPEVRRKLQDTFIDLTERRMAIDANSLVDIRVDGADGIGQSLLSLVAAFKRMPMGGKEKKEEKEGGKKVRVPGGTKIMSEEERKGYGIP